MRDFVRAWRHPGDEGGGLVRASPRAVRNDPGQRSVLEAYDELLSRREPRRVFVVTGVEPSDPRVLGRTFAKAFPGAVVTVFVTTEAFPVAAAGQRSERLEVVSTPTLGRLRRQFARRPAPDVVVDHGAYSAALKHNLFSHLFLALVDGGTYLVDGLARPVSAAHDDREGQTLAELVAALRAIPASATKRDVASPDDLERALALGGCVEHGPVTALTKRGTHYLKVREEEVDEILPARLGPGWGRVLEVASAARTVSSGATPWMNRPSPRDDVILADFEIPAMTVRVLHDVVCMPRQLVASGDVAGPASFHHPQLKRLRNRGTFDVARWFLRPPEPFGDLRTLPGAYYHLASEFPGHFGHVITEDLSRLWAWDRARQEIPGLRVLVGTEGEPGPRGFELDLLRGYGIDPDDVVTVDEPVRVEHLVTATPQFHNGRYVDPAIAVTWDRIGAALATPDPSQPRRIFVTREPGRDRECLNGPEVEARFVEAGFSVLQPERLSMTEQVSLFAGAEVVAGYGGSGMLTSVFTPPGASRIVVSSDSYHAANEWLISSVKGDRHFQLWCPSTRPPRSRTFELRSFHAPFRFDFARDGDALGRVLDAVS